MSDQRGCVVRHALTEAGTEFRIIEHSGGVSVEYLLPGRRRFQPFVATWRIECLTVGERLVGRTRGGVVWESRSPVCHVV